MFNNLIREYTKKPITIQAVLYDGSKESIDAILELNQSRDVQFYIGDHYLDTQEELYQGLNANKKIECYIRTLEGTMKANIGDYIIKGISGEIYPCKPDIFQQSYEPYEHEIYGKGEF